MTVQKKVNYGWYHVRMMTIYGLIGILGILSIILTLIIQGFIGLFFLIIGIICLIFFLWPALGILTVNLYSKTGKAHPIIDNNGLKIFSNPKILDIGCGSGRVAIKLAKQVKDKGHVYGIDIFNNAIKGNSLEMVQENAKLEGVANQTTFQYGSVLEIPFEDNNFDFINMSYVFHEIPEKVKALREIKRVIKPEGIFWLTEFHRNSLGSILINGIYTLFFKSHNFWFNLFKENEIEVLEYRRKLAIGIFILKLK
ncbi:MAG: class I SAM-dependent methyltransferase [Promethearchaeota archaeon]